MQDFYCYILYSCKYTPLCFTLWLSFRVLSNFGYCKRIHSKGRRGNLARSKSYHSSLAETVSPSYFCNQPPKNCLWADFCFVCCCDSWGHKQRNCKAVNITVLCSKFSSYNVCPGAQCSKLITTWYGPMSVWSRDGIWALWIGVGHCFIV